MEEMLTHQLMRVSVLALNLPGSPLTTWDILLRTPV